MSKKIILKKNVKKEIKDNRIHDIAFELKSENSKFDLKTLNLREAVRDSLINSLNFKQGSSVLFPDISSPIHDMLFNNVADIDTKKTSLYAYLDSLEPRIIIQGLDLFFDYTEFSEYVANIILQYYIRGEDELEIINLTIANQT